MASNVDAKIRASRTRTFVATGCAVIPTASSCQSARRLLGEKKTGQVRRGRRTFQAMYPSPISSICRRRAVPIGAERDISGGASTITTRRPASNRLAVGDGLPELHAAPLAHAPPATGERSKRLRNLAATAKVPAPDSSLHLRRRSTLLDSRHLASATGVDMRRQLAAYLPPSRRHQPTTHRHTDAGSADMGGSALRTGAIRLSP
jgi:hypothetical protein